ncbi:MAG: hypothetical protein ACRCZF_09800 [Gemmataceae bacterium]
MAYSDFDLRTALRAFGLTEVAQHDLFSGVEPRTPGMTLQHALEENAPVALGMGTEKVISEWIISPILLEARAQSPTPLMIYSGVALDVDRQRGLTGFCDFLLARTKTFHFVQGPLVAVVEAKRGLIADGLGQCVAAMVGIREFNQRDGFEHDTVHGVVTSGNLWKFLRLHGAIVEIDIREYTLAELPQILGILVNVTGTGARASAA